MDYEEIICDANNLYRAYKVSVKTSKWKETTQKFMMNFLRYIFSIQDDLMNRTLQNGPTQEFTLFERGRVRPITSIQIRDRIIRHVLCDEVLLPEVKKHIIYDNCASIKGRGILTRTLILQCTPSNCCSGYLVPIHLRQCRKSISSRCESPLLLWNRNHVHLLAVPIRAIQWLDHLF